MALPEEDRSVYIHQ